jgi:hypothetical protein
MMAKDTRPLVLYIDDHRAAADHDIDVLEQYGFRVEFAPDASVGYYRAKTEGSEVAAVILDLVLNTGDMFTEEESKLGYRTGELLYPRLRELLPETPIIAVSVERAVVARFQRAYPADPHLLALDRTDVYPETMAEILGGTKPERERFGSAVLANSAAPGLNTIHRSAKKSKLIGYLLTSAYVMHEFVLEHVRHWIHNWLIEYGHVGAYAAKSAAWTWDHKFQTLLVLALSYGIGVLAHANWVDSQNKRRVGHLNARPRLSPGYAPEVHQSGSGEAIRIWNAGELAQEVSISPFRVFLEIARFDAVGDIINNAIITAYVRMPGRELAAAGALEAGFTRWLKFLGRDSITVEFTLTYRDAELRWFRSSCEMEYRDVRVGPYPLTVRTVLEELIPPPPAG